MLRSEKKVGRKKNSGIMLQAHCSIFYLYAPSIFTFNFQGKAGKSLLCTQCTIFKEYFCGAKKNFFFGGFMDLFFSVSPHFIFYAHLG